MRLRIRWKFTLWYGATLALILLGFSVLILLMVRHELIARTDRQLAEELRELSLEMRLSQSAQDLLEQTRRRFAEHDVYYFQIAAPSGESVFQSEALKGGPALPSRTAPVDAERIGYETRVIPQIGVSRVATATADGPGGPYVVTALTSMAPVEEDMAMIVMVLLGAGPIALGLAIVGGYTLARRALSPVDRIVEVANRITATDLQQRVDVVNPDDELGRLAQTLNALIDRLQKAIEEMRRFTADAAHELRTPLAVLRSEVEIALRAPRSAEEYRRALEVASEEANWLTRLADQLLFLSRHEAGMLETRFDDVRLDALIKDVVDEFSGRSRAKGLNIEIESLEPWTVLGDDIRLSRVFYNVIDNAVKHTPAGGRIVVRGQSGSGQVRIAIADNGPGIAPEHLPHVFKRFYCVDGSRNRDQRGGGAGLGLAIAQTAVAAHGGSISIESNGRGTRVTVALPWTGSVSLDDSPQDDPASLAC